MKNYKLFPKVTLWVLMIVGIIATAMFFFGGSEGSLEVAGDFLDIPKFTNVLLYWIYALVVLVILVTFGSVLAKLMAAEHRIGNRAWTARLPADRRLDTLWSSSSRWGQSHTAQAEGFLLFLLSISPSGRFGSLWCCCSSRL